jgi:AcrR family transcriptional regulator
MSSESPTKILGLRERKTREARRAIRQSAFKLFSEQSYESVSVEQIAAAANVSRTTFFNYFPTKEAVITEPDPEALERLQTLCEARPPHEPLWQALSIVILEGFRRGQDALIAQKRMKALSPALSQMVHKSYERTLAELRKWAEQRVPARDRDLALLQLNVSVAAILTVFEQWQTDQPFEEFESMARDYLKRVGTAFA